MIECKIVKTARVFPLESFAMYGNTAGPYIMIIDHYTMIIDHYDPKVGFYSMIVDHYYTMNMTAKQYGGYDRNSKIAAWDWRNHIFTILKRY